MKNFLLVFGILFTIISCKDNAIPKPKAQLALEYPTAKYALLNDGCSYQFYKNELAEVKKIGNCNLELHYPKMKATIYVNYSNVNNNIDKLLQDAQNLTYKHAVKANDIAEQPYVNTKDKVYGMFYQVGGNAATNAQFYITDSTKNFINASLYFYSKPNFDSILPAADYLKNDMKKIIETIKWQ
jgi:gliding motility-associated lipoprotein GldD